MSPSGRAVRTGFGRDVAAAALVAVAAFTAVAAVFEAIEGHAGRLPAIALLALPVAGAVAGAWTASAWRADGRLVAVLASGVAPGRLASSAFAAVLLLAVGLAALREATAPPEPGVVARTADAWFTAHDGVVVGALVEDGRAVGRVAGTAVRWRADGAVAVAADVPTSWSAPPSWTTPVRALGSAPPSPGRTAWLVERVGTPVLAAALAAAGALLGAAGRSVVAAAGLAGLAHLLAIGLLAWLAAG